MADLIKPEDVMPILGISPETASAREKYVVNFALTSAQGATKRYLKYDYQYTVDRVEYYPQMDFSQAGRQVLWESTDTEAYTREIAEASSDELQIAGLPIRSISELKVDYDGKSGARAGSFPDSSIWTEGVDFWPNYDGQDSSGNSICRDGIIRSQGRWPNLPGTVKITYTSGYTENELKGVDAVIDASPIYQVVVEEAVRRSLKVFNEGKKLLAGFSGPLSSENLGDYSYSVNTGAMDKILSGGDLSASSMERLFEFVRFDGGVM